MLKGVRHYTPLSGFHVMRIHYSADPDRDPETPEGRQWIENEAKGIPGGVSSTQWRQEQEIDWEASGGELVFPQFSMYENRIVVAPFTVPERWKLYGSFDYGHRNPSCFLVNAIDGEGNVWTVWEYYASGVGYRKQSRAIRSCEFYDKLSYLPIADPSIWAKTQQQTDESPVKSVAQLFQELPEKEQVLFVPAKSGGDITAAEKINGELWNELDKKPPSWRIFASCPKTLWELRKLRYADWSAGAMEVKNFREEIVDKDNHAWDAQKMFFMMFFWGPGAETIDPLDNLKQSDPASYAEWKRVERMSTPGGGKSMGEWD